MRILPLFAFNLSSQNPVSCAYAPAGWDWEYFKLGIRESGKVPPCGWLVSYHFRRDATHCNETDISMQPRPRRLHSLASSLGAERAQYHGLWDEATRFSCSCDNITALKGSLISFFKFTFCYLRTFFTYRYNYTDPNVPTVSNPRPGALI
jgi:hypothetical protein